MLIRPPAVLAIITNLAACASGPHGASGTTAASGATSESGTTAESGTTGASGTPSASDATAKSGTAASNSASAAGTTASTAAASDATLPMRTGDVHDFDFLAGAWTVTNRRLKARGVGSSDWEEFPATDCATSYLGSMVSVDELRFPTKGWAGVTVRNFQPEKRQWSIYWINSRTGTLFPPVHGGFTGNIGEFYGHDEDDGKPVKVRFRWTKVSPDRAHWEQAFSTDGRTWEVNWTNDFTRADPSLCAAQPHATR